MCFENDGGTKTITIGEKDGAAMTTGTLQTTAFVFSTATDYWFRLILDGTNLELKIFSDPFITEIDTTSHTIVGTITGLRYFVFQNRSNGIDSGSHTGFINDMKMTNNT